MGVKGEEARDLIWSLTMLGGIVIVVEGAKGVVMVMVVDLVEEEITEIIGITGITGITGIIGITETTIGIESETEVMINEAEMETNNEGVEETETEEIAINGNLNPHHAHLLLPHHHNHQPTMVQHNALSHLHRDLALN